MKTIIAGLLSSITILMFSCDNRDMTSSAVRIVNTTVASGSVIGSGVILPNGLVLTVAHVVDGTDRVEVQSQSGKRQMAHVIWHDEASDLAIARLEGEFDAPASRLSCARPEVGARVETVGNPLGLKFVHLWGRVSSAIDVYDGATSLMLIDMTVAPGNSGGPVYDSAGNVVGLIDRVVTYQNGLVGIALAVPSTVICKML